MVIPIILKENREAECNESIIGKTMENNASILYIEVPKNYSDKAITLEFEKPNGDVFTTSPLDIIYNEEEKKYYAEYSIIRALVDVKGILKVEIVLRDEEDMVLKTYKLEFDVLESINATEEIPEILPTIVDELETAIGKNTAKINELKEESKDISKNIEEVNTNMDSINKDIKNVNLDIKKLYDTKAEKETTDDLQNQIDDFAETISEIDRDIANIENDIDELEEKIPTKVSQLQNDAKYAKISDIPEATKISSDTGNILTTGSDKGLYAPETDLSNYAKKTEIPRIPTKVSSFTNDAGYLTTHQDISGKVDKVSGKGLSTNDYTNIDKAEVAKIKDKANKSDIPTDYIKKEEDPTVPSYVKSITENDIERWNNGGGVAIDDTSTTATNKTWSAKKINNSLEGKVDKEENKGLSTNDLTNELKAKYDKAEQNVQSDWNETDNKSDAYIRNKPNLENLTKVQSVSVDNVKLTPDSNKNVNINLSNKVDKEEGKGLISNTEIQRLKNVDNYDDTEVKENIDALTEKISEIELFKYPNVIIHGEPNINNGQVSEFSNLNYLDFPSLFNLNGKGFEFKFTFTTKEDVSKAQNILGSKYCMALFVQDSGLHLRVSSNGTSWDLVNLEAIDQIAPNTTYYVKIKFNRLSYTLSLSTDDITYIDIASRNTGDISPKPSLLYIGVGNNFFNPFLGIINLNKCYLKINNSVVWQGMDDAGLSTRLATDLENIDDDGVIAIKDIISTEGYAKKKDIPEGSVISEDEGNILTKGEDKGLYVPKTNVPTKTSQLTNDSEFITKTIDNLTNYYSKTETYSQTEVKNLIDAVDLSEYAKSKDVVAIQQEVADKGKVLGIGEDGNVKPVESPTPDMSEYIKNATPAGYDVTIEADKNKGKDAIYIRTTNSDDDWNGEIRIDADGWIVGNATGQSYLNIIDARDKTKRYTPISMKYDSEDDPAKVVAVSGDKFTFNGKDIATSDYVLADNNTNLNNLKRTGRYFFLHSRTYGNLPTNVVNGWLDVKVSDGASTVVKQVFYRQGTNGTNDFEIYVRTFSTTWSEWTKLLTEKQSTHTITYTATNGTTKTITIFGK